jgi:hypothetical protein
VTSSKLNSRIRIMILRTERVEEFDFDSTPVNEALIRDLANGASVVDQRNTVLIGGTDRQVASVHRHNPWIARFASLRRPRLTASTKWPELVLNASKGAMRSFRER